MNYAVSTELVSEGEEEEEVSLLTVCVSFAGGLSVSFEPLRVFVSEFEVLLSEPEPVLRPLPLRSAEAVRVELVLLE